MPTLNAAGLHTSRRQLNISITADEADLLVSLLRPWAHLLAELFEVQVQACPRGCSDWADTADALAVVNSALVKVRNAQVRQPEARQ